MNKDIRTLAHVPRWTIIRTLRTQSVAEHSYYVALYAGMIWDLMNDPMCIKSKLLWYALVHDIDELVTGDIPSPVKHKEIHGVVVPDFSNNSPTAHEVAGIEPPLVNDQIVQIVKLADILEAVLFISDEQKLGNKEVNALYYHLKGQLKERASGFEENIQTKINSMVYNNALDPRLIK